MFSGMTGEGCIGAGDFCTVVVVGSGVFWSPAGRRRASASGRRGLAGVSYKPINKTTNHSITQRTDPSTAQLIHQLINQADS